MELPGYYVCLHVGLGSPQHPLPPRNQGVYNALARIPYASLAHRSGNHDPMGIQAIARSTGNHEDGEL